MTSDTLLPVISLHTLTQGSDAELEQLRAALTDHGFFYLSDHGIDPTLIDNGFDLLATFFAKPAEEKLVGQDRDRNLGWTFLRQETLDSQRFMSKGDFKESFYVGQGNLASDPLLPLPPTLEESKETLSALWKESERTALQVLEGFAKVLGLPNRFFEPHHKGQLDRLRLIHYPPASVSSSDDYDSDIRASEHSDFGSLTLLFQKDVAGLQVKVKQPGQTRESWVEVPPRPGCLVVNVADAMELWTCGRLRSTVHRVRMPTSDQETKSRYSIALFCHPDAETVLDPAFLSTASQHPSILSEQGDGTTVAQIMASKRIPYYPGQAPYESGDYLQARLRASYTQAPN
ncbi:hypothetical protein OC846_000624 [Tilletia horrida]|uniref:Fe2OG dioxygenase domain-containing protein n=1 Tax=Tilletia horrida TaxID=155126 RepID=A0AAN6JTQ4_9BASI|nr:hypothetical protein OC846_000624 [Tilletia horrida]